MSTPQEVLKQIEANPAALAGVKGVFQFKVTGPDGGDWYVDNSGEEPVVGEGMHASPGCTFTCSDEDFVAMANGTLKSQMAFMLGKLKVEGDMMLAMQLQKIFP